MDQSVCLSACLGFFAFACQVILDVVFNHTAEGNEMGPTISFRGIDNRVFYMTAPLVGRGREGGRDRRTNGWMDGWRGRKEGRTGGASTVEG